MNDNTMTIEKTEIKRGPGRPREKMTKMLTVVMRNGNWQAAGRGKPNMAMQRKQVPVAWNWKIGDPILFS